MALFNTGKKMIPKTLGDKYLASPFSILDAKSGYWMQRKQAWEQLLQDRTDNIRDTVAKGNTPYINNFEKDDFKGAKSPGAGMISTFDPFLCEILISWFSLQNMRILDPFAGGIVRGAVASMLGRKYYGIDISKNQIDHNLTNWESFKNRCAIKESDIVWKLGDSEQILSTADLPEMNMVLMCPPYYDLEKYTDLDDDLSNMPSYGEFLIKYGNIIRLCYDVLSNDSFAVTVVEEIRNDSGELVGFVPDTINAFKRAGFHYYNEMILEQRIVSLGIRCPKYFDQSRKVGRHHQNVLVFYKGDMKHIGEKFGKFIND